MFFRILLLINRVSSQQDDLGYELLGTLHFLSYYGTILPLGGQLFAVTRPETIRREKDSDRSTTTVYRVYSCCCKSCFCWYKTYFRFYSSLFTNSPETPINTGVASGEE